MSTKEERVTAREITSDLKITGNVETTNKLLIEGEVLGEVRGSTVVIDKKGRVTGGIVAEEVVVSGVVLGSIQGKRVHLQYTSHVEGDIFHASLLIEEGASFQGQLHRSMRTTRGPAPFSKR
jgi:cytoskeletal protein CcmA (bactofilin family)